MKPGMNVTANAAKNRLGQVLEHAQRAPIFIDRAGRRQCVVSSLWNEDFRRR